MSALVPATAFLVVLVGGALRPPPARVVGPAPRRPTVRRPRGLVALAAGAVGLLVGPFPAAVAVVVVLGLPVLRRRRAAQRALTAVESDIPEVVDLLVLAVGAGLTVRHALRVVTPRAPPGILRDALAGVLADADRGRRLADAVDDLPGRAGEPTRPLAAALAACERYGAPVGEALTRLAAETRDRQRRRAEQAARRVPVLLLFPLAVCILPAFALLAVAPLIADAVAVSRL